MPVQIERRFTSTLTRRGFVKAGGALMVSFAMPVGLFATAAEAKLASILFSSWLEIRHDNTILVRTGRTEIGTGMSAYYAQVIAEELYMKPEAITCLWEIRTRHRMAATQQGPFGARLICVRLLRIRIRHCLIWARRDLA